MDLTEQVEAVLNEWANLYCANAIINQDQSIPSSNSPCTMESPFVKRHLPSQQLITIPRTYAARDSSSSMIAH
jgi:hypothetical protein